jgi:hypothetical protein
MCPLCKVHFSATFIPNSPSLYPLIDSFPLKVKSASYSSPPQRDHDDPHTSRPAPIGCGKLGVAMAHLRLRVGLSGPFAGWRTRSDTGQIMRGLADTNGLRRIGSGAWMLCSYMLYDLRVLGIEVEISCSHVKPRTCTPYFGSLACITPSFRANPTAATLRALKRICHSLTIRTHKVPKL